jgi:hypothetical protein
MVPNILWFGGLLEARTIMNLMWLIGLKLEIRVSALRHSILSKRRNSVFVITRYMAGDRLSNQII